MRKLIATFALAAAFVLPSVSAGSDLVTAAGYAHDAGDYHIAAKLYRTAAELGDPRAQEMLGLMYLMGEENYGAIFPRDVNAALEWFGRAAEQKSAFGMQMLNSLVLQQQATQGYPGDLADAAAVAKDAVVYPGDAADRAAVDFVYPGDLSDAAAGALYVPVPYDYATVGHGYAMPTEPMVEQSDDDDAAVVAELPSRASR